MNIQPRHIVQSFDKDLARVHRQVVAMGDFVIDQLEKLLAAIQTQDSALAYGVTKRKSQIIQMEVECDTDIFALLARRCPVARDLRMVMTASKVVSCLERAGDNAIKMAHVLLEQLQQQNPALVQSSECILAAGQRTQSMLRTALACYDRQDFDSARRIVQQNSIPHVELDANMRQLMSAIAAQPLIESVSQVLILKSLDRLGDLAVEIARDVVFLSEDDA